MMTMAKRTPKRHPKTGRFVSKAQSASRSSATNENTPFAPGGNGLPGGWTVNPGKPTKSKRQKLPKIIRHEDPVDPNYFANNLGTIIERQKIMVKKGYTAEFTPRLAKAIKKMEMAKARDAKAKKAKKEKKESKSDSVASE